MNTENDMNEEVRQLLDSLEEHGKNARRQQRLGDLIDSLESSGTKRRRLIPLWWVMGAAAACLLIWLLANPNLQQTPDMEENNLVEKVEATDSVKVEENVIEEPMVMEELLAEETPSVPQKTPTKMEKPRMQVAEEKAEEPVLAEVIQEEPTTPTDTENIGSNNIPVQNEEKLSTLNSQLSTPNSQLSTLNSQLSTQDSPQRRVIRSLNLVCYECQKEPEPEFTTKPNVDNRILFGQPQDPNMKNGSLALEFKLK